MSFELKKLPALKYLRFKTWEDEGIQHGFTGAELFFKGEREKSDAKLFCKELDLYRLFYLEQVHGKSFLDLRDKSKEAEIFQLSNNDSGWPLMRIEADAFIIPSSFSAPKGKQVAFAIKTADCIPLIIRAEESIALIHAGWRGLEAGIIEAVTKALGKESFTEVLIGPCAGYEQYEIGEDVIKRLKFKLGDKVAFKAAEKEGKFLLNLAGTAERVVIGQNKLSKVHHSSICTIENDNYHSYRNTGSKAGRNLSFYIPPVTSSAT